MDRNSAPYRQNGAAGAALETGGEKVSKQHKRRLTPQSWFKLLFRQPPAGMYRRPSVYMTGTQMEIEHFRRIRTYDQNKLCLELYGGTFTVYGDQMQILSLAAHRITLQGRFVRTDFTDGVDA